SDASRVNLRLVPLLAIACTHSSRPGGPGELIGQPLAAVPSGLSRPITPAPCPALVSTAPVSLVGAPPAEGHQLDFGAGGVLYFFTDHVSGAFEPCGDRWRPISSGVPHELLVRAARDPVGLQVHVGGGFAGAFWYGAPGDYRAFSSTVIGAL